MCQAAHEQEEDPAHGKKCHGKEYISPLPPAPKPTKRASSEARPPAGPPPGYERGSASSAPSRASSAPGRTKALPAEVPPKQGMKKILPWLIAAKDAGVRKGETTTTLLDLDVRVIQKAGETLGTATGFQVKLVFHCENAH